ncbi:hypothetical protein M951_chr2101 (nucleomorph) [Lotharella oceanica]|uniref:Uncharacterized protein n=2 Tax=Lotharella oceanica TaxID=641309 RepID=A0A060DG82_9EUKA|nr:hypothetical protein M951_chr2101 [Lotharella oceanica]
MSYFQKEKLIRYLLINNYYRNPFEILKRFLYLEKNMNFLLYFKKKLIKNCIDIIRFHKLNFYSPINSLNLIDLKTVTIMENLRIEITLNMYKIIRLQKIQHLNPLILLQKNYKKINFSEKIYVLKLFKLINYYIIKNLLFIFPINFVRFKTNLFKYIKIVKILYISKTNLLMYQVNKNFKFILLSKSKILYSCYSYIHSLMINLKYLKDLMYTFVIF